MNNNLRLCLDLNIWCAALLADAKGRKGTACQTLVEIVRCGNCNLGKVELVISWGMLNRLQQVLQTQPKLQVLPDDAITYINIIHGYTKISPQLTLGGTGIIPISDIEDQHVLETALSGKATILITANFEDFLTKDVEIIIPERHGIYRSPSHSLQIVHPYLMMNWFNEGKIPILDP
ncbi:PIN domain-containing protein [Sphaerospermopsis sp. FACHB-1094]|uniref:PIN domain-containing protein n=1 Tax=Sphaerospermopsis sp. FACHB-1094 TaxID=2692861 RepID=UPI0016886EF2|nr:PIN domain-containing protein [Sphaerospermopsis sp. FACHB-1094]MBD2134948.1 PIN domain-containing protein [Sphaerospermopsis sp. FACHB-1094]